MKEKFKLIEVGDEDLDKPLEIYKSNEEYFRISMGKLPTMENVLEDKNEIPPNSSWENKNYKLIEYDAEIIGVIDYIMKYPDEDAIYIGLFMIKGQVHRHGFGRRFMEEFTGNMKALGYERIRLGVLDLNKKAYDFWLSMGFNLVKEVVSTIHPERNWTIKVMEKLI